LRRPNPRLPRRRCRRRSNHWMNMAYVITDGMAGSGGAVTWRGHLAGLPQSITSSVRMCFALSTFHGHSNKDRQTHLVCVMGLCPGLSVSFPVDLRLSILTCDNTSRGGWAVQGRPARGPIQTPPLKVAGFELRH